MTDRKTDSQINAEINALCEQASKLAPRAAEEALDSGCTNLRPTGPRQGRAWDLVQQALNLNATLGVERKPEMVSCSYCNERMPAGLACSNCDVAVCEDCEEAGRHCQCHEERMAERMAAQLDAEEAIRQLESLAEAPLQIQCCETWLDYPTPGQPVTCPECGSIFAVEFAQAARVRRAGAQVVQSRYASTGREFWTVECRECLVVLNSGHHYGKLHLHFAYELAEQHNATHHKGNA